MPLIDVALPLPLFRTFTYRVPDGMTGSLAPGSRVVVPFRNGNELGIVVGVGEARDGMKLKDVVSAPDDAPVMDEPMLALCRWIAEYYVVPLGSRASDCASCRADRRERSGPRAQDATRSRDHVRAHVAASSRRHLCASATAASVV